MTKKNIISIQRGGKMSRSRKSVSQKEWLSLFEKSLHETELKRSREEIEAPADVAVAPASPEKKIKPEEAAPAPVTPPAFAIVTQFAQITAKEDMGNPLFNLAEAAEDMAAEQARAASEAKVAEEARMAALVALRDKLKAECQAEMKAALAELIYKESLRRIDTIEAFEIDFIEDEIARPSTTSIFKVQASTPLQRAAFDGDLNRVKQLLSCPTNFVDSCDGSGLSPLWLAAYANHVDVVKELIKHGANYDLTCVRHYKSVGTPYEIAEKNAKAGDLTATAITEAILEHERQFFTSFSSFDNN
jgi:hypothetical protein